MTFPFFVIGKEVPSSCFLEGTWSILSIAGREIPGKVWRGPDIQQCLCLIVSMKEELGWAEMVTHFPHVIFGGLCRIPASGRCVLTQRASNCTPNIIVCSVVVEVLPMPPGV